MGKQKHTAYEREVLEIAGSLGFQVVRRTSKNHLVLRHTIHGVQTTISSTPADGRRAAKNAASQLRRMSEGAAQ
jgi:hypothetical protein